MGIPTPAPAAVGGTAPRPDAAVRPADATIEFAVEPSSIGLVLVAASQVGLVSVMLGDDADTLVEELRQRHPHASLAPATEATRAAARQIVATVETGRDAPDLPKDVHGTPFQERVWAALRAIPPGTTATYTEIAAALGMPRAVRAVAGACAANALALLIPCHRVVRHDGSVSGYRWGVDRKRALIAREAAAREAGAVEAPPDHAGSRGARSGRRTVAPRR